MYLEYYHLHLKPFQISTDPRFLWLGEKHQEALSVLKYGILDNKGFLLLTGDVGTGKTTLLNALVDSLGEDVLVAMVPDPGLSKMDFFHFTADSFGMQRNFQSKGEFLIALKKYLLEIHHQGKQALLIIDECQRLNQELLEEVRLLSNIEKTNTKLINIFFVGQSEFNDIIISHHNRAIRQRITINYNIYALSRVEAEAYIRFRLGVAGSEEGVFTSGAIDEIYRFSNGYPRLINIICDQALLTGFVKERKFIDEKIVAECADELKIERVSFEQEIAAIPETKSEEADELHKPDQASRVTGLTALGKQTPLNKSMMVLAVIMIVWAGLMIVFMFNRCASESDSRSAKALEVEPSDTVADSNFGKAVTHEGGPPQTAVALDAGVTINPLPVENANPSDSRMAAVNDIEEIPRAEGIESTPPITSRTNGDDETAVPPMVLEEIHTAYGTYPEVHFGFNSNRLGEESYELLGLIARYCLQNPEVIVILRGYTDRSGVRAYNMKLAEFRADMVKSYLAGKGITEENITTIGVGPGEEGPGGIKVPFDGKRRKVIIEIIAPTV